MNKPHTLPEQYVIEVAAERLQGSSSEAQPRLTATTHSTQTGHSQAEAQHSPYTGGSAAAVGGGLGFAGAPNTPNAEEQYKETFIGIHHSSRGVRIALQANTRTAILIVIVLVLMVSRPGVVDLVISLLKGLTGVQ